MKPLFTQFVWLTAAMSMSGCANLPLFASTPAVSSTGPMPAAADEWEYLVVSNGRVYFGLPSKQASGSIAFRDEAVGTQTSLDQLGREGWELVTVVGLIGGDQEFILKRRKKKA